MAYKYILTSGPVLDQPGSYRRSHRILHLPSPELASIFLARRMQQSLSLVDREVDFCVLKPTLMGTKYLYENGPNSFFLFGTKNMVRVKLMATILFRHGFNN